MLPFILLFLAFAFVLGAVTGSFLNVCIFRIPEKQSIVSPPSHCPSCGAGIKFYDNVPLLSYLILQGKCRHCKMSISFRYPLIELLTALASVMLMIHFGPTLSYLIYLVLVSLLIVITFIDLDHRIIPDVISLPAIPLGFAASFLLPYLTWLDSLIGIVAGGGLLLLVAVVYEALTGQEGMGGGDIKLLAMVGAFLGWKGVLFTLMASSFLGTVIGGGLMALSGKGRKFALPFGPFLSLGAIIYLFWGELLIDWYLTFFERGGPPL
ncbi:MAG: prepilin peptidase [Deltaproteobacteria bacterium]|nr:prepilin peptidase [Deltaproteobacteria bacterium]